MPISPISPLSLPSASNVTLPASFSGKATPDEVVEIGLLLPAEWAAALLELSKARRESVGQILRSIIRHALIDSDASVWRNPGV
jgi:hypothetical protein